MVDTVAILLKKTESWCIACTHVRTASTLDDLRGYSDPMAQWILNDLQSGAPGNLKKVMWGLVHVAALVTNASILKALIEAGANPNYVGYRNRGALHWACLRLDRYGSGNADMLVGKGACTQTQDDEGNTPPADPHLADQIKKTK